LVFFASGMLPWQVATGFLFIAMLFLFIVTLVATHLSTAQNLVTLLFMLVLSLPGTFVPMIHDYRTAERIDEVLKVEDHKLVYSDNTLTFILTIEGTQQPLILAFSSDDSKKFYHIKADFLDGTLKVEKRRKKAWNQDTARTVYEISGYEFK